MRPWRLLRQSEKFGKRISHSFSNEEENVMAVKYVFVTGGVVSGLGKGITAASLGRLLKARGYKVTMQDCAREWEEKGYRVDIFREEPFTVSRDSVEGKYYVMIWKKGFRNQKVKIEEIL